MSAIFRNIFLTLTFVLILFTPPIRFLPHYTWLLALLGVISLLTPSFRREIKFNSKSNRNFIAILAFLIIFNCVLVPVTHEFKDFTYIPFQIGIILVLLRNILLVYCLDRFTQGDIFSEYCKYFFIACSIYVAFTLIFIIDPGFKDFWIESILFDVKDKSQDFAVYAFRYSLDGFAAFSSATVFSFACLFCCYLIAKNRKVNITQVACLILMVVGCFFYGRVSLIGMLLGAWLIVRSSSNVGKTIKIATIVTILILVLLSILNIASRSNESLLLWQDWAFSIVKQVFVEKEVTDYSVTHMVEDMYYMPEPFTMILGDGQYTNPDESYYGHTDVGFMRLTLYGGFISLLLAYGAIIYLSKITIETSQSSIFKKFIFFSAILFFILEMKGETYQRAIMMLYPFFLIQNIKNYRTTHGHKAKNLNYNTGL